MGVWTLILQAEINRAANQERSRFAAFHHQETSGHGPRCWILAAEERLTPGLAFTLPASQIGTVWAAGQLQMREAGAGGDLD